MRWEWPFSRDFLMKGFFSTDDKDLFGIDDPEIVRQVQRAAWQRAGGITGLFVVIVGSALLVVVLHQVIIHVVSSWPFWASAAIAGVFSASILGMVERRVRRRAMPEILRSLNRCGHCGYGPFVPGVEKCPECGTCKPVDSMRQPRGSD
jgi:hypothetical protein